MKLQSLYYFITIAELKSFTRAAQQLYVSQPALSKAIHHLEEELMCPLFVKFGRNLELSDQGRLVYQSAKKIIREIDNLKMKVKAVSEENMKLSIGYVIFGHLEYLRKRVEKLNRVELISVYDSVVKIKEHLIKDEIDVALLPNGCERGIDDAEILYLTQHQLYVLVAKEHPLFTKETVSFKDLKTIPIVGWDNEDTPNVANSHDRAFFKTGIVPQIVARGKKLGDVVMAMMRYQAVGLCSPYTASLPQHEYRTILVKDSDPVFGLCLVWKKQNKNPALRKLLEYL